MAHTEHCFEIKNIKVNLLVAAVCMTPRDRANFIITTFQCFARPIALHITFVGRAPHLLVLPICTRTSHSPVHIWTCIVDTCMFFLGRLCITVLPIFSLKLYSIFMRSAGQAYILNLMSIFLSTNVTISIRNSAFLISLLKNCRYLRVQTVPPSIIDQSEFVDSEFSLICSISAINKSFLFILVTSIPVSIRTCNLLQKPPAFQPVSFWRIVLLFISNF